MKESIVNTIVSNSFRLSSFSHKIADPQQGQGSQKPFDGFSVMPGVPIYWETKLLKGYKAFAFRKIEKHQIENLKIIKFCLPKGECIVILAIWKPRSYLDLYFFDIKTIVDKMKISLSYKKVELLQMKENKLCTTLLPGHKLFDPIEALSKKI